MITPDNKYSTLAQIRIKVRKLTRSPSASQISDSEIDNYINNFVLYDFPEHLRTFYLRTTLTFYTQPYVDVYATDTTNVDDPLYNFNNIYTTTHAPIYVAGYQAYMSQSREQFFGVFPMFNNIAQIGAGDGITTNFSGTLSAVPVLANNVTFSSVDVNNLGLVLKDDGNGNLVIPNSTPTVPASTINYVTGAYTINFPTAPASGVAVNSMTVPYVPSRPTGVLYYENKFTFRAVPDQPYPVNLEVYKRPTEILNGTDMPELSEWWQYIAYGATKKVLEDRMDIETVQLIMPEFKQQELLILRRTLVQLTNERTATIFTEQSSIGTVGNGLGWGGGNF